MFGGTHFSGKHILQVQQLNWETGYDSVEMSRKINSHFILTHRAASMQEYRRWNLFALVDVDLATKWLARALHYSNFTEAKNGWELNVPAQIK